MNVNNISLWQFLLKCHNWYISLSEPLTKMSLSFEITECNGVISFIKMEFLLQYYLLINSIVWMLKKNFFFSCAFLASWIRRTHSLTNTQQRGRKVTDRNNIHNKNTEFFYKWNFIFRIIYCDFMRQRHLNCRLFWYFFEYLHCCKR